MIRIIMAFLLLSVSSLSFAGKSYSWQCSSFFINSEGYIATAAHCINHSEDIAVIVNKQWNKAKVIAVDYDNDVAIIKINKYTPDYFKIAIRPNSDDVVYILGYPLVDQRGYDLKIQKGSVKSENQKLYRVAGGSCEGNSGGAVVNSSNNVIGVLSFGYGSSPCAYFVGVRKIQHVLFLAKIYNIRVDVPAAQGPMLYNEDRVRNADIHKVPILYGTKSE